MWYVIHSYNMGTRDSPDIYAKGCRPEGTGIYIMHISSAHVISNILYMPLCTL